MLRVTSIDEVLSHAARKSRSKPGILGVSGLLYTDSSSPVRRRIVLSGTRRHWEIDEQGETDRRRAADGMVRNALSLGSLVIPQGARPASHTLCARRSEKRSATSKCAGPMHPLSPTPRYTRTFGAVACMCTPSRARPPSPPLATSHTCPARVLRAVLCLGSGFCLRTCGERGRARTLE